jgi:hypothetical protein
MPGGTPGHHFWDLPAGCKIRLMMSLTTKQVELLISGVIGISGTVVGSALTAIGSRVLKSWDHRKAVRKNLDRFRRLIQNNESTWSASQWLRQLKELILENDQLLEKPGIKKFYDEWLKDPGIDDCQEHTRFSGVADIPSAIEQLKVDSDGLRW